MYIDVSAGPLRATRPRGVLTQSSKFASFHASNLAGLEDYSLAFFQLAKCGKKT